jgi:hypothetical protein
VIVKTKVLLNKAHQTAIQFTGLEAAGGVVIVANRQDGEDVNTNSEAFL